MAATIGTYQLKKVRQCPDKPGSVSLHGWRELCHLSTLQVTLHLKRSTLRRCTRGTSGRLPLT